MKILVVLLVVVLGLWLLLRGRGGGKKPAEPADEAARPAGKPPEAVPMIACARCGVHLPRGDALADARGRLYCGGEHRDAGPA